MGKRLEDHIPPHILEAGLRGGAGRPDWYVGRSHDPDHQRKMTLDDLAREVGEKLAAAAKDTPTEAIITEDQLPSDEKI